MMKTRNLTSALFGIGGALFAGTAFATDYWAGNFSNAVVNVGSGCTETLGSVNLMDEATLEKTGAGELVVPLANIVQQKDFRLKVSAGRVKVTAGTAASLPTPTEILNRATLWLAADDTESLVTATDGSGNEYVARWLDTRETKTSAPFDYLRARGEFFSTAGNTATNYPVKATADGLPVVDLQGFGSGAVFCFESTENETAGSTSLNAYEVFAVYCQTRNKYGFLFGGASWGYNNIAFHPSTSSITPSSGTILRMETASQLDARWWWNGTEIDAMKYGCSLSSRVFGTHFTGIAGNLNGIGNYKLSTGQYADRNGGDGYAEVLVFTNRLTLAEHARVERYLCAKYGKTVAATTSYTFDLAPGAEIVLDGVSEDAVKITGSVTRVCPAEGDCTIGYDGGTDMTIVSPGSGTVTLKCDAAYPATVGSELAAGEGLVGADLTQTAASDGAQADIVKTGRQKATLRRIPEGTRRLSVREGVLALSSAFAETNREVYATITNWNFNGLLTGNNYNSAFKWGVRYGWQVYYWPLRGSSGTFDDSYMEFVRLRDWRTLANPQWYDYRGWNFENMIDNGYVGLRGASAISTTVSVPEDGMYELSLDWSRTTYFSRLCVLMGADTNHLSDVGCLIDIDGDTTDPTHNSNGYLTWNRRSIRVGWLSKGSVTLMFRNDVDGESNYRAYSFIDNVTMKKLPTADTVCDLPGGDFEGLVTNTAFASNLVANDRKFGLAYRLDDWECVQPDGGYWAVGPTTRGMWSTNVSKSVDQYFGYYSYLLERCDRPGHAQLVMGNTGGYAQKRVTLPAGTWKLMADLVSFHKSDDMGYKLRTQTSDAILSATVTVGAGAATSLGTLIAPGARAKFDQEWGNSFTVPEGGAEVLVRLQTTSEKAGVVVDGLRLRQVGAENGNLVTDGEFDVDKASTAWMCDTSRRVDDKSSPLNRVRAGVNCGIDSSEAAQYVHCTPHYDGATTGNFAIIGDCATVCQDVAFPTSGLYRLTYYTRSRYNATATGNELGYGRNRLLAYVAAEGVTNAIDIALVDTTNWVQHAAVFKVAAAGTQSFGFRGLNVPTETVTYNDADKSGWDKAAFFDGVSIVRLSSEEVYAPVSLPANLTVRVANGAKLQLGFDGTYDVETVYLGSKAVLGPVNAQTYPDYVIGPGTLNAKRRPGLLISFR